MSYGSDTAEYIGKSLEEIQRKVSLIREWLPGMISTCEYEGSRLNVKTENGIVTEAWWG